MAQDAEKLSALELFSSCCEDLIGSKFILADIKIAALLRVIASHKELYDVLAECLRGFDFDGEYKRAKLPCEVTGYTNRFTLVPPKRKGAFIAFVTCLLSAFDTKQIDLAEFLQEFFYEDGSMYEAYKRFASEVLKPYNLCVRQAFNEFDFNLKDREIFFSRDYFKGELVEIEPGVIDTLERQIKNVAAAASADSGVEVELCGEIMDISEAFANAVRSRERRFIKLFYIAFKNTVNPYRKAEQAVIVITRILRQEKLI